MPPAESVIPRVIHWLWLGPAPLPAIFDHYTDSWRRHHPAWEFRLWRDDTLPPLSCHREYADAKFKVRYDIARLEILRQLGGVIMDLDVEAIRPIDPLLAGASAFIGRVSGDHVGNQLLGASPHHPFFERAVARIPTSIHAQRSSDRVGKAFLHQLLEEYPDDITVFPPETFHYQPSFDPPRRPDDFPTVYAVHHELTSYAEPPPADAFDTALDALMAAARAEPSAARDERLRAAARRLAKAAHRQQRGYAALLRRTQAELEQARARLAVAGGEHAGRLR